MSADAMSLGRESLRAVELKGRMMLVSVMRLHTTDPRELDAVLRRRMMEAPELMRDMPVVVDTSELAGAALTELLIVLERARWHGFKLIGLQRSGVATEDLAEASGLPLLVLTGKADLPVEAAPRERSADVQPQAEPGPEPVPRSLVHTPTTLITQPVRSGQQVYARGGDLIVLGAVSAGAEVLADGHIHIHGALRGRALAGVRGLFSARIYCRRLDAELISIAGHYRISEDILDRERGDSRMISLVGEALAIDAV